MKTISHLPLAGREVAVSSLDKIFYPAAKFTKGDVLDYYQSIAPVLLPHLSGRAVTLKRYPDGVGGDYFYEKNCPSHAPSWIKTSKVKKSDGSVINYCLLDDLPSLIWAANLANLELHPFLHRTTARTRPTAVVFDLDPGPAAGLRECGQVALWIRDLLAGLPLQSFVKTSGSKGLQLIAPLNSKTTYATTKPFAKAVADALSASFPDKVTSTMRKDQRRGRVLVDWSQNDAKKTTVCVYSLRAMDSPTVSTPVAWDELESFMKRKSARGLSFTASETLKRVAQHGDLFSGALELSQTLPSIRQVAG